MRYYSWGAVTGLCVTVTAEHQELLVKLVLCVTLVKSIKKHIQRPTSTKKT